MKLVYCKMHQMTRLCFPTLAEALLSLLRKAKTRIAKRKTTTIMVIVLELLSDAFFFDFVFLSVRGSDVDELLSASVVTVASDVVAETFFLKIRPYCGPE